MSVPPKPPIPYLRLPFQFDVAHLRESLAQIRDEEWVAHPNTGDYEGEWRCVPLRSVDGRPDHILSLSGMDYADCAILDRCPFFREVIDSFRCDKTSVRLMSMEAGGRIRVHRDHGTAFEDGLARLHVPIVTAPEVLFTIGDERVHFDAGHTWYLNADCPHGVRNDSRGPRVHLMLDCIVNPWLTQLFAEAGFLPADRPKYGDPTIADDNVAAVIAALHAIGSPAAQHLAAQLARVRDAGEKQ